MLAGAALRHFNPQALTVLSPSQWLVNTEHPHLPDPSEPQRLALRQAK
jgi:hypothetical protein